jgi:hypothetical protein
VIKKINKKNIQIKNEILYTEWVPAGIFVKIVVSFVSILILSLSIVISILAYKELAFVGIILGIMTLFIFLMYWNYRGLRITLTKNQLDVKYGIFNHKNIPLNAITKCDITKARFKTYGGAGIRLGLDGSSAYNTDFGEAVKLTFQHGRPFLFSTRNPQDICNLISEYK